MQSGVNSYTGNSLMGTCSVLVKVKFNRMELPVAANRSLNLPKVASKEKFKIHMLVLGRVRICRVTYSFVYGEFSTLIITYYVSLFKDSSNKLQLPIAANRYTNGFT